MIAAAYTLRSQDDDFGQAGTLVREIWNDAQSANYGETVAGSLNGVIEPVLTNTLACLHNIDAETGDAIAAKVRG